MKRIFWVVLMAVLISMSCGNNSYAAYLEAGNYLEKNQWGALEDILTDWKAGKLTTDECALYGCYVLAAQEPARTDKNDKAKLIPAKYELNKKSSETGPYFFISFLYDYEDKLSEKAIDELIKSDWYDYDVLTMVPESIKTDEIIRNIPNSSDEYILFDKYYEALLEKKMVSSEFKALIYAMRLPCQKERIYKIFYKINGFKKYKIKLGNLILSKVLKYYSNKNCYEVLKSIKSIKCRNLINYHLYMHQLFINGKRTKYITDPEQKFYITYKLVDADTPHTDSDYVTANLYLQACVKCYELFSKFGIKDIVNFNSTYKKIDIVLFDGLNPGEPNSVGYTEPIDYLPSFVINRCKINIFLGSVNVLIDKAKKVLKNPANADALINTHTIISHEFIHASMLSYIDKTSTTQWYDSIFNPSDDESATKTINFIESLATYGGDAIISNVYCPFNVYMSLNYFFDSAIGQFPNFGIINNNNGYEFGFFWRYFFSTYTDENLNNILNMLAIHKVPDTLINKIFETKKMGLGEFVNNFSVRNFFITKKQGIDPEETIFKELFKGGSISITPLTLKKLTASDYDINKAASHIFRLIPETGNYFENSVTISFTVNDFNSLGKLKFSVIALWHNAEISKEIGSLLHPIEVNDKLVKFKYYTKKGLNPSQFIVVITNGDITNHSVSTDITIDKPDPPDPSYSQISNSGKSFENDIKDFFINNNGIINNVKNFDSEIATLYAKYKGDTSNNFYGNQLYQKIVDLNLYMQTTINQIHDLRYQYYLMKMSVVNSIMEGASSSNIAPQIKKFCIFVKEAANKIGANTNSIDVFNGWVVMYHLENKLKTTKAPANWTQEEYAAFDKESNAAMNKISSAFSNSKYEYKYTNEQIKDSVSTPMVGVFAIEIPGPIVNPPPIPITPGPFMVNFSPNIEKKLAAAKVPVSYKFSDLIIGGFNFVADGKPYNSKDLLCISDTFAPLSLKYFSSIAVHAYHEDNMPPQPAVSNMKNYVSSLGFYMKVCKDHASDTNTTDAFFNTKDIMIGGASKRITEIISLLAEAIIKEMKDGKNDLYTALNKELALVPYKNEVLDLLEKQLKKDGYRE